MSYPVYDLVSYVNSKTLFALVAMIYKKICTTFSYFLDYGSLPES